MINSSERKANLIKLEAEAYTKRLAEQQQQMEDLISQKRGKKTDSSLLNDNMHNWLNCQQDFWHIGVWFQRQDLIP